MPGSTTMFSAAKSYQRTVAWKGLIKYALLLFACALFLIPPFYSLLTSIKSTAQIANDAGNPWIVTDPTISHYADILASPAFRGFMLNSIIVTATTVTLSLFISLMAAFAISRIEFRLRDHLGYLVFIVYLIPPSLLFIPLFKFLSSLGLINSLYALILVYPTLAIPYSTWMLIGYFNSVPKELDEAAIIDGASYWTILWRIFVPISTPGLVAAFIFSFTVSWGMFLYPVAFIYTPESMPITVGIVKELIKGDVFQWGKIMAASVIAALPPLIIYTFLMDLYVEGLTSGATKG